MKTYAGIDPVYAQKDSSEIWLQSIPYDGTSTWGKGADKGFMAFMDASENMELFDIETNSEVFRKGIHLLPELKGFSNPDQMFRKIYQNTTDLLKTGKFLSFFGGEHSISIGIMKAFYEKYPEISILHLDAHADLRPEYLGSPYNHACALHQAVLQSHVIHAGIRSMDAGELPFLKKENCYFMQDIHFSNNWIEKLVNQLHETVYISLDLDVLDPSVLPGTGTPEPGGMDWYMLIALLRKVFAKKNVLGFDIVELAPVEGSRVSEFLAAKLYYKMLSYKFHGK